MMIDNSRVSILGTQDVHLTDDQEKEIQQLDAKVNSFIDKLYKSGSTKDSQEHLDFKT